MISVLASSFSLFKKKHNHFFPVSNISVRFQSFLSIVNIIFVLFSEEEGVYVLIGVSGRKILILLTSSEHSFYTTCCHLHRMYLWVLSSRSLIFLMLLTHDPLGLVLLHWPSRAQHNMLVVKSCWENCFIKTYVKFKWPERALVEWRGGRGSHLDRKFQKQ